MTSDPLHHLPQENCTISNQKGKWEVLFERKILMKIFDNLTLILKNMNISIISLSFPRNNNFYGDSEASRKELETQTELLKKYPPEQVVFNVSTKQERPELEKAPDFNQ
jgi:hypothetical protein